MSNRTSAPTNLENAHLKESHARVARLVYTARESLLRTRAQLEDLQGVLGQVEGQAGRLEEISARLGAMTVEAATRLIGREPSEAKLVEARQVEDMANAAKAASLAHRALLNNLAEARAEVTESLRNLDDCLRALDSVADEMGAMVAGDLARAAHAVNVAMEGVAWHPPRVTVPRSPLIDRVGELWPLAKRLGDLKN